MPTFQGERMEPNHGLTFTREDVVCIWRDSELVAIEWQPNGKIVRFMTTAATKADSMALLGLDKVK